MQTSRIGRNRARWAFLLTGVASTVAATCLACVLSAAGMATAATAGSPAKVQLPVVRCATTYGISPTPKPVAMGATVPVPVPASQASLLAVYADGGGYATLAPRGWHCSAQEGADGSTGLAVFPAGQKAGSASKEVDLNSTGGCVGCAISQACALFSSAAAAARSFPMSCKAKPADEKVVKVNAHLVTYEDPPHVKGDGVRSGGLNADNGAMTYYAAPNASFQGDCTLPASDKSLCTTVLNQFIRWFGSV